MLFRNIPQLPPRFLGICGARVNLRAARGVCGGLPFYKPVLFERRPAAGALGAARHVAAHLRERAAGALASTRRTQRRGRLVNQYYDDSRCVLRLAHGKRPEPPEHGLEKSE
eukprot:366124-Chlamydomonas_euryale.AAC.21